MTDKSEFVDMISEATRQSRRRVMPRIVDLQPVAKETSRLSHWPPDHWLRREVSLGAVGRSTMRGINRRYDWAVASLIKSTNSGLSATAVSLAKSSSQGTSLRFAC